MVTSPPSRMPRARSSSHTHRLRGRKSSSACGPSCHANTAAAVAGTMQPFVGGSVGFTRLSSVQSEFSVPAAGVVLSDVDFLDSSTVASFGGSAGVLINVSSRLAFQGGVEFRWHGDAEDLDGLAGTGLEPINDEARRWAMPITAGVTVKF